MAQIEKGWNEYQLLVLDKLERLSDAVDDLVKIQTEQTVTIEGLKLKTGFIATISGFITAIGLDLGKYLIR